MSTSRGSAGSTRNERPPLAHAVYGTSIPDAIKQARARWTAHRLLDDLHETHRLERRQKKIAKACKRLEIATIGDLLTRSGEVLGHITTTKDVTRFVSDPLALHRTHNVIAATVSAVLHDAHVDAADPLTWLPDYPRPKGRRNPRPLRDDEILLLRQQAAFATTKIVRYHLSAIQYVLAEAGARPSETTIVTPRDFDDPRDPTLLRLPGIPKIAKKREVPLPAWSRPMLACYMDRQLARSRHASTLPVAYNGLHEAGGHDASASASGNLKRAMREARMASEGPTPSGIVKWRVGLELRMNGVHHAAALMGSGENLNRVYEFTGLRPGDTPRPANRISTYAGR